MVEASAHAPWLPGDLLTIDKDWEDAWKRGVSMRRQIHRHPELRFQETRTSGLIAHRLRGFGYTVREGIAGTGLVARYDGPGPGPHIALRAELDALPIQDGIETSYRSVNDGVCHACGHDVHMAATVMAAEMFARMPANGTLSVILQPAEETPFGELSGAREMMKHGVPDDDVVAMLAVHCWPGLPVGTIGIDSHIAMAAKDAFRISIHGQASHAATPAMGRDAILALSQVVTSLHHLISRNVDPSDQAILNVGTITGGVTQSVIPEFAEATGTLRSVDPRVRERLRDSVAGIVDALTLTGNSVGTLTWANEMPPVLNDARMVERARTVIAATLGPASVRSMPSPPMTSDDFALFAARVPSLYMKLGIDSDERPLGALHTTAFDVDEHSIYVAARALLALAVDLMTNPLPLDDQESSFSKTSQHERKEH